MKLRYKITTIVITIVLTFITCIPIFATPTTLDYLTMIPADLGDEKRVNNPDWTWGGITKQYIKIDNYENDFAIRLLYLDDNEVSQYTYIYEYDHTQNQLILTSSFTGSNYSILLIPNIKIDKNNLGTIYIPVYCYQCDIYINQLNIGLGATIYYSTITDQDILQREFYQLGYNNGYRDGYDEGLYDGQNIQDYTNLTGYVTQLLTQFVGSETAPYITPIALVLVILFVYFLFIRFLLSMLKAKGVIKTCDIIMIVACIILLIIMYAPMLDLTIKNETINTTESTEVARTSNTKIYTIHTETGDIMYGPVGSVIINETVETTNSDQLETELESLVTTDKETINETEENYLRN